MDETERDDSAPDDLAPGLYVTAVPIGNLGDLTPRALRVLRAADHVLCEDTRVTANLLRHFGIKRQLSAYHEHNAAKRRPEILEWLGEDASVALVADAGTPLIADPGYKLVRAAQDEGYRVHTVPGPSALLAALSIAGLPTDRVLFVGFLPPKASARRKVIEEIKPVRATLVLYETAPRLAEALADLAEIFGAREAAVARELTKLFEEVRRGPLADLAAHYQAHSVKGELVVLIGPHDGTATLNEGDLDARLQALLSEYKPSDAAQRLAQETGLARKALYQRALALKQA